MNIKSIPAFYFEEEKLKSWADEYHDGFVTARPFPHVVIDNFVPEDIHEILIEEFPAIDAMEAVKRK